MCSKIFSQKIFHTEMISAYFIPFSFFIVVVEWDPMRSQQFYDSQRVWHTANVTYLPKSTFWSTSTKASLSALFYGLLVIVIHRVSILLTVWMVAFENIFIVGSIVFFCIRILLFIFDYNTEFIVCGSTVNMHRWLCVVAGGITRYR